MESKALSAYQQLRKLMASRSPQQQRQIDEIRNAYVRGEIDMDTAFAYFNTIDPAAARLMGEVFLERMVKQAAARKPDVRILTAKGGTSGRL